MESPDIIPLVAHLAHTKEMDASVTYGTYGMNKFLAGEPTVTKGVCGTKSSLLGTLHHAYGAISLLHVKFLKPCVVGIALVPFLCELPFTLFLAQSVVLIRSLLTVKGEVNRYCGATVEVCENQFLETQYAPVFHVVKHTADAFYRNSGLLQSRIIDDIAARLVVLLRVFLAKDGEETDAYAEQQSAPVHRLTAHHAVIAVLSSVNQRVEVPAVHAKYARPIEAEQAEGDNQLQGRYALLFLQTKPTEGLGKPKSSEYRHNVVVHSLFFVQKLVHLVNIC